MQTWAGRGVPTALVTGGLLMLGTGVASATENVDPDLPAPPLDGGGTVPVHVGDNAVGALSDTHSSAGADTVTNGDHGAVAGNVVTTPVSQVEHVLGAGIAAAGNSTANGFNDTATTAGGNVRTSGEWGALSGDLLDVPTGDVPQAAVDDAAVLGNQSAIAFDRTTARSGGTAHSAGGLPLVVPIGAATTVYDVPVDVLGRAVDSGFQRLVVRDGDTAPRLNVPFGGAEEQSFGPSDDVDGLLRADQVPAVRNLPEPRSRPLPPDATQVFPVLSDGVPATTPAAAPRAVPALPAAAPSTVPSTVAAAAPATVPSLVDGPAVEARFKRLSGELPVAGSLPRFPVGPRTQAARPGGPRPQAGPSGAGPNLPGPHLPTPQVPGPVPRNLPKPGPFGGPSVQSGARWPSGRGVPPLPPLSRPQPSGPITEAMPRLGGPGAQAGPALPPLPTPHVSAPDVPSLPELRAPRVSGPITDGLPAEQDAPVASAEQLMAQLRGLINELESTDSGHLRPLDVTRFHEPDVDEL